jgi:steroid 5-alpha reductase family enzyme
MLEGCVTVLYTAVTAGFALFSVLASLSGWRGRLQRCDSLWPLLLAIAAVVYAASMALAAQGRACRDWW